MTTALRKSSNGGLRRLFGNGSFPSMPQEMEDLFDRFGFERNWPVLESATGTVPALDLSETESSVDVKLDIPGFKSDDIDISEQIRAMRLEMFQAAEALDFERAARLRDELKRLEGLAGKDGIALDSGAVYDPYSAGTKKAKSSWMRR